MEKIKGKRIKYLGKRVSIEALDIDFGNGNEGSFERLFFTKRETDEKPFLSAMIAAVDEDENVYLIEQFQAGSETRQLVLPKGGVEQGDDLNSTINKELMEEIGYKAEKFELIGKIEALPSYVQLVTYLYLATKLLPAQATGDELEDTTVIKLPLVGAIAKVLKGEIVDARTVACLLLLKTLRDA